MTATDIALAVVRIPLQWFIALLDRSGMVSIFVGMLIISMVHRYILAPLFGATIMTAASDTVRTTKENLRKKGKYERGQTGKYLRKGRK